MSVLLHVGAVVEPGTLAILRPGNDNNSRNQTTNFNQFYVYHKDPTKILLAASETIKVLYEADRSHRERAGAYGRVVRYKRMRDQPAIGPSHIVVKLPFHPDGLDNDLAVLRALMKHYHQIGIEHMMRSNVLKHPQLNNKIVGMVMEACTDDLGMALQLPHPVSWVFIQSLIFAVLLDSIKIYKHTGLIHSDLKLQNMLYTKYNDAEYMLIGDLGGFHPEGLKIFRPNNPAEPWAPATFRRRGVDTNCAAHLAFQIGLMCLLLLFRFRTGEPAREGREPRFLEWLFAHAAELQEKDGPGALDGLDVNSFWQQTEHYLRSDDDSNPQRDWEYGIDRQTGQRRRFINGLRRHIEYYCAKYDRRDALEIREILNQVGRLLLCPPTTTMRQLAEMYTIDYEDPPAEAELEEGEIREMLS